MTSIYLADDIALVQRAADIAGKALWPEAANIVVRPETFDHLAGELGAARARGADYHLIGDEVAMLMQAARRVVMERGGENSPLLERWTRIGELLRAAVELDLVNARKSLGEGA